MNRRPERQGEGRVVEKAFAFIEQEVQGQVGPVAYFIGRAREDNRNKLLMLVPIRAFSKVIIPLTNPGIVAGFGAALGITLLVMFAVAFWLTTRKQGDVPMG
ncbi:MAG: hypothetical protein H0W43_11230 [Chthoniobacterales bacterium]|nr:hypothetical protein [Chthoniobacterales bacterium]